jgi:hypothetical protein
MHAAQSAQYLIWQEHVRRSSTQRASTRFVEYQQQAANAATSAIYCVTFSSIQHADMNTQYAAFMTLMSSVLVIVVLLLPIKRAVRGYAVAVATAVQLAEVAVADYCTKEPVYMCFAHLLADCDVCISI